MMSLVLVTYRTLVAYCKRQRAQKVHFEPLPLTVHYHVFKRSLNEGLRGVGLDFFSLKVGKNSSFTEPTKVG